MGIVHFMSASGEQSGLGESSSAEKERGAQKQRYAILLVEEDIDDRNFMLQTLARSPFVHNVHWFESGESILAHFAHEAPRGQAPTLVLLGAQGGDLQILRRLKEDALTRDIPVIVMADSLCDEMAKEVLALNACTFMVKPLCLDRLHEAMSAKP